MENILPSKNALEQHVRRAVYIAGYIWGKAIIDHHALPSPENWCWKRDDNNSSLTPCWLTLGTASKVCQELIKCGCKASCTKDVHVSKLT